MARKYKLPKSFTTVTTLSKTIAFLLFITLPFVGFSLGYWYKGKTTPITNIVQNVCARNHDSINPEGK